MSQLEMDAVVRAADGVGAWILADEVYAGAEHNQDHVTPSFWDRYERVLAVGSISKAYALPGLRIGWVVSPEETAHKIWARQDYITICTSVLANKIAAYALSPDVRPGLIKRTRAYVRKGFENLHRWVDEHPALLSVTSPQAAAIAFVNYNRDINSSKLVDRLIVLNHIREYY